MKSKKPEKKQENFFFVLVLLMLCFIFLPVPGRQINVLASETANGNSERREATAAKQLTSILTVGTEYTMQCSVTTFLPDRSPMTKTFQVYTKRDPQKQKTLLVTLSPPRDRGILILMIEDQIWQYFPSAGKTMNMNAAVALHGNVNITDILTGAVFSLYRKDSYRYDSERGVDILSFKALGRQAPYGEVRYYLKNGTLLYLEAYARSEILLKKISFPEHRAGQYPATIKIKNALREGEYAIIEMSGLKETEIPDYYFNPASLQKVNGTLK